jgi:hypothetical protein
MTVDPNDGTLGFSFRAGAASADVDATLERLLELPAELASERGRRVALVFDEFQEVAGIDRHLPSLMRAVFQTQPDVAHVYLGSKRSMMEEIFNDANEPFWRSAKKLELDVIEPAAFRGYIQKRFKATSRGIEPAVVDALLAATGGHPYATQELCYFLWEETPRDEAATTDRFEAALAAVLRSEHAHFSLLWAGASGVQKVVLQALAKEPGRPYTGAYRDRHGLPAATNLQKALRALEQREAIAGEGGFYRVVEPFLAEWLAVQESSVPS